MKKLLVVIFTITLTFSLAACGGNAEPEVVPAPAEAADTVPLPEDITDEADEENGQPEEPGQSEEIESVSVPEAVNGVEVPPFSVDVQGTAVTDEDMASYQIYLVQTTSTNTYGTTKTRVYIGYIISDVLTAAGFEEDFSVLLALADDGYTVSVSYEVAMEDTTLLAISEDGKTFKLGPWFAPCSSDVSPDYLRDLAYITLEN